MICRSARAGAAARSESNSISGSVMRMDRTRNRVEPVGYGKNGPLSGPDGTTLALLCWNLVKCPGGPKIPILRQIFRTLRATFACKGNRLDLHCLVFHPASPRIPLTKLHLLSATAILASMAPSLVQARSHHVRLHMLPYQTSYKHN